MFFIVDKKAVLGELFGQMIESLSVYGTISETIRGGAGLQIEQAVIHSEFECFNLVLGRSMLLFEEVTLNLHFDVVK